MYDYILLYCTYYMISYYVIMYSGEEGQAQATANLGTNTMDFRGFDSSISLILTGGTLVMYTGDFPESLSQAILVGRLGVPMPNSIGIGTNNRVDPNVYCIQTVGPNRILVGRPDAEQQKGRLGVARQVAPNYSRGRGRSAGGLSATGKGTGCTII